MKLCIFNHTFIICILYLGHTTTLCFISISYQDFNVLQVYLEEFSVTHHVRAQLSLIYTNAIVLHAHTILVPVEEL